MVLVVQCGGGIYMCALFVCVSGGGVVTHVWCDGVSFVV